jgi:hypothetical protein
VLGLAHLSARVTFAQETTAEDMIGMGPPVHRRQEVCYQTIYNGTWNLGTATIEGLSVTLGYSSTILRDASLSPSPHLAEPWLQHTLADRLWFAGVLDVSGKISVFNTSF